MQNNLKKACGHLSVRRHLPCHPQSLFTILAQSLFTILTSKIQNLALLPFRLVPLVLIVVRKLILSSSRSGMRRIPFLEHLGRGAFSLVRLLVLGGAIVLQIKPVLAIDIA